MTLPDDPAPAVPSEPSGPATKRRSLRKPIALGSAIVFGAALAVIVSTHDLVKIGSPGMAPALMAGDRVVVRKTAYGWRERRVPERGDLVVFPSPDHPESTVVKRVIGLAGDSITLQQGIVLINGWRVPTCVAGLAKFDVGGKEHNVVAIVELLGDTAYLVFHDDAGSDKNDVVATPRDAANHAHADEAHSNEHAEESEEHAQGESTEHSHGGHMQGPYTVRDDEVFVLGDNRENSHDSRAWLDGHGTGVRVDRIKGRASAIGMSAGAAGKTDWSRAGSLAGAPQCPKAFPAETCAGLQKCLANRPSRETTTPPAPAPRAPSPSPSPSPPPSP
jgi:signal peptidase I